MAKRVAFTEQAKADIRAIPQGIALQILRTLARFLASDEGNVKRLKGIEPPLYRLRTQDHRIVFRSRRPHRSHPRPQSQGSVPLTTAKRNALKVIYLANASEVVYDEAIEAVAARICPVSRNNRNWGAG